MLWRAPSRCTQDVVFAAKWPYLGGPKSGEGASLSVLPSVTYLCFFVFQFTEFHSTVLWATFYFFMILHLLEALCLVTEGWLSCQLQRSTFWFAAMARRTQQVTFHFPHSKQILFSLTWHRRYLGENFGGRGFKPRKHVCCSSPQPALCFMEIRG